MRCLPIVVTLGLTAACLASPPVSFDSLLAEMTDRNVVAQLPDPAYTCRQFSSYDRASTAPGKLNDKGQDTWFANGDADKYLREEKTAGRTEWVMADMAGPGAIVRIWSANPKGTLRIYLDGATEPAIAAPMTDLLGAKWTAGGVTIGEPLSGERSRGWNLYLPIPYARHCKVTSDERGFYYQVNYRTYAPGTEVRTFTAQDPATHGALLQSTQQTLAAPREPFRVVGDGKTLGAGESTTLTLGAGNTAALSGISLRLDAYNRDQALRSTVLAFEFDGETTAWCPVGDFFGSGVGTTPFQDWYRAVHADGTMSAWFVMPYQNSASLTITNLGKAPVTVAWGLGILGWEWDDRSLHFGATWRHEHPIHAYGGRGTQDFNYATITGKGVYVGDSLAVMNPVEAWWGEGDEKIYVDGETFPSHFGTGTEDYYGYAWCCNVPFTHPFHAQPRCDGQTLGGNYGHTTVGRVRSLDAIPFESSLRMDIEVWHWAECDVAYAATTYFYAAPGVTTNRPAQPEEAAKPIPQPPPLPPPFKIEGAVECEGLGIAARSPETPAGAQDMKGFGRETWSGDAHLWVQARKPGDFVEVVVPASGAGPQRLTLYATRSWDYGIVRVSVNGKQAGSDLDLYSGARDKCLATGPIDLGTHPPVNGAYRLRVEVVGANAAATGTRAFFGLDCLTLGKP